MKRDTVLLATSVAVDRIWLSSQSIEALRTQLVEAISVLPVNEEEAEEKYTELPKLPAALFEIRAGKSQTAREQAIEHKRAREERKKNRATIFISQELTFGHVCLSVCLSYLSA